MTLNQIKCLWEVVITGNFTEAADRLYMTQSAVSKNIMALEKELGVTLLDRTSRPHTLSTAGAGLITHFGEIILAYERTESKLQEIKRSTKPSSENNFRLVGMPAMTRFGITASINAFLHEHPEYSISQEEMDEDRVLLALQMGDCDIAFCSTLRLKLEDYHVQKYSEEHLSMAISYKHPMAHREFLTLSDMANQSWIFPPPQAMHYHVGLDSCKENGFSPNVILTTSRPATALEYLQNHYSDSVYMEMDGILNTYASDLLRIIHIENSLQFEFLFAWKKNMLLPKAAKEYLDYMSVLER